MDQGIIQAVKLKYRGKQWKQILINIDNTDKVGSQLLIEISILDAIYWIRSAWKDLDPKTIVKYFKRCGFNFDANDGVQICDDDVSEGTEDEDDDVPIAVLSLAHELFWMWF